MNSVSKRTNKPKRSRLSPEIRPSTESTPPSGLLVTSLVPPGLYGSTFYLKFILTNWISRSKKMTFNFFLISTRLAWPGPRLVDIPLVLLSPFDSIQSLRVGVPLWHKLDMVWIAPRTERNLLGTLSCCQQNPPTTSRNNCRSSTFKSLF